jgi:hypothetical protein
LRVAHARKNFPWRIPVRRTASSGRARPTSSPWRSSCPKRCSRRKPGCA